MDRSLVILFGIGPDNKMTMPSRKPPLPLRLIFSSVGAAILLAATVLVGLYLGGQTQQRFSNIDQSWGLYTGEAERRGELLSRIRGHLGYGGIIHNFKNYVLRKDPAYLEILNSQLANLGATVMEYRESGATEIELEQLAAIEATVKTYVAKIPIAVKAAEENWPPSRTDRLVKVDDTNAVKALEALDTYWRDKRRETTETIAEAVAEGGNLVTLGFRFLGGLAIVALAIYALFYLLQRELRQSIGRLSIELRERKAAELQAKKFLRAVEQSPATIVITDTRGVIEYVNDKFCSLTEYRPAELIGKTPRILQSGNSPPETYLGLRQQLARGEEWYGTFQNLKKSGETYWARTSILPLRDDTGTITHFIGLGEDITERRQVRNQIHRAQKMEAVGLLASGVAHDFNNVLTTILGNVHLARLDAPDEGEFTEELDQIEIAAKRARNLVGQVLAFARRRPGEAIALRIGEAMNEVAKLLRASILPTVSLKCEVEDANLSVLADPTRLHQVIMNLCSNAAEAIGPAGGTVTLHAFRASGSGDGSSRVCLRVSDTGPGIPEAIRKQIFDPFFTTKPAGKGTGLGLSVVANLVADMSGQIELKSSGADGSTFEILLPEAMAGPDTVVLNEDLAIGSGCILLIDDDAEVAATCSKLLRRQNYEVETFVNPPDALKAFESHPNRYSVVMTDFVMPDMNGEEVCRSVRVLRPDCPIILYTAYQPATLDLAELQPIRLLEKPIDPAQLIGTVRDLLNPVPAQ